jgi:hypothetical protein
MPWADQDDERYGAQWLAAWALLSADHREAIALIIEEDDFLSDLFCFE